MTITRRLEGVPEYLDSLLARLDTPLARWVSMDLQKVAELPELFATLRGWAGEIGWRGRARLETASRAAEAALRAYASRLAALPTTRQLHLDEVDARRIVALKGIDRSLEELHVMAREFLAETVRWSIACEAVWSPSTGWRATARPTTSRVFLPHRYRVEPPDGRLEEILDRYEAERRRIDEFITARELFPVPAEQDLRIMRTPGLHDAEHPGRAR